MKAAQNHTGPKAALTSIWSNKHYEFYQQIVDNLNLTGGLGDHSNYSDLSDSVSSISKDKEKSAKSKGATGGSHHKATPKKIK